MTKRRGLRHWVQLALSIFFAAMVARVAFVEGDKVAQVVLALTLIFLAYVLGYATGFRSAKRRQSLAADHPNNSTEDPVN